MIKAYYSIIMITNQDNLQLAFRKILKMINTTHLVRVIEMEKFSDLVPVYAATKMTNLCFQPWVQSTWQEQKLKMSKKSVEIDKHSTDVQRFFSLFSHYQPFPFSVFLKRISENGSIESS